MGGLARLSTVVAHGGGTARDEGSAWQPLPRASRTHPACVDGVTCAAGRGTARDERSASRRFPEASRTRPARAARWRARQDSNLRPPA